MYYICKYLGIMPSDLSIIPFFPLFPPLFEFNELLIIAGTATVSHTAFPYAFRREQIVIYGKKSECPSL